VNPSNVEHLMRGDAIEILETKEVSVAGKAERKHKNAGVNIHEYHFARKV
jgi:hypothetical protein